MIDEFTDAPMRHTASMGKHVLYDFNASRPE